jgi:ABC-type nitrate/sulfonate/bicarbonate transport system substrate-binding protein
MKRTKKLLSLLVAGTFLIGGLAGCAGSTDSTSASDTTAASDTADASDDISVSDSEEAEASSDSAVKVRISYWDYSIQGLMFSAAQEFGIWDEVLQDVDADIELIAFENGPAANESIIAGELDGELSIGDQPFLTGNANGVDTSLLSTIIKQEESYVTVVAADSDINSYADLAGKNIGVGIGTFSHKSIIGILGDNGITSSDVEFSNLGDSAYAEALTAIDKGELDAYFGPWVSLSEAIDAGSVKVIGDSTGHPLTTYLALTNDFIEAHPDITEDLVEILYKTVDYINNNREEAVAYFAKQLDWDEDLTSQMLDKVELVADLTDEDFASIEETQQFLLDQDILDEEIDGLIENHTNDTFIKNVKGEN